MGAENRRVRLATTPKAQPLSKPTKSRKFTNKMGESKCDKMRRQATS